MSNGHAQRFQLKIVPAPVEQVNHKPQTAHLGWAKLSLHLHGSCVLLDCLSDFGRWIPILLCRKTYFELWLVNMSEIRSAVSCGQVAIVVSWANDAWQPGALGPTHMQPNMRWRWGSSGNICHLAIAEAKSPMIPVEIRGKRHLSSQHKTIRS